MSDFHEYNFGFIATGGRTPSPLVSNATSFTSIPSQAQISQSQIPQQVRQQKAVKTYSQTQSNIKNSPTYGMYKQQY
ncbi:hypothetical protein IMG5_065990 [Ichthyophthirius multifiliis]|uniref:Uncharacterized protein n=1 Tax=Ichthyophthirius multifiliis TaxID=5932 RepID=G0QPA6_ICHMU|nr:hypothetical protein IMG5_065990 [Ichthyophthirius multifiliis]EGR32943.1 hypothetical protein IMG5_065990 [Ichthyophthirius multifiliis]|eukprot:XP_004036929.1 hypothetical protein IMG5_065990 [Ichthyophthirius multifiliis]